MLRAILGAALFLFFSGYAIAQPSGPPPAGKVWVEVGGSWTLVVAPPEVGPFLWADGRWVPDRKPPRARVEWVPAHWGPKRWVHGHWEAVPVPGPGATWVSGHWDRNKWVPGHWRGKHPHGKTWVGGRWGPKGVWVHGHWR